MVKLDVTVEVDLPILSPTGRIEFERKLRQRVTQLYRKRVATPQRRMLPVGPTGRLKKRFRVGRPTRRRVAGVSISVAEFKYKFWLERPTQAIPYERVIKEIQEEAPEILQEAAILAMQDVGLR